MCVLIILRGILDLPLQRIHCTLFEPVCCIIHQLTSPLLRVCISSNTNYVECACEFWHTDVTTTDTFESIYPLKLHFSDFTLVGKFKDILYGNPLVALASKVRFLDYESVAHGRYISWAATDHVLSRRNRSRNRVSIECRSSSPTIQFNRVCQRAESWRSSARARARASYRALSVVCCARRGCGLACCALS